MKYRIGEKASVSRTFSEKDVLQFAELSGDYNPLHLRANERTGIFSGNIVHGVLLESLISCVLGMDMPGNGTIYLEQSVRFMKPVYYGDKVTARAEISEIINSQKNVLRVATSIENQNDEVVLEGYAIVKAPWKENGER